MYEVTLVVIKPDGYARKEEIQKTIAKRGYKLLAMKEPYFFTEKKAAAQYAEHNDRPFFNELVEMMLGSTSVMIYGKENAIADMSQFVGHTNPARAERGTLRRKYGRNVPKNAVHRSDSQESVLREVKLHFTDDELPEIVRHVLTGYDIELNGGPELLDPTSLTRDLYERQIK